MAACTACGADAPQGARHCPACGSRLGPDPESRKVVTVLFCDLVDSTAITEGDPEVARRVIAGYFEQLRTVIVRHGGTVEKFIGDEVMAVYGVPQAHEDDALRAVRSAVEIREAVASLGAPLAIRIGVNTGEVVAGDTSAGHGFLTGDPVVVGKRLEQTAESGEILIGDTTFALVRDAVVVEDRNELDVKGKTTPVAARRLLAVLSEAPGVRRRLGPELVGRDRELALLLDAFEGAAREGRGRLVTVLGPAGVGKSRLVRELVAGVGDDADVFGGRCLAYGDGITFWPMLDVVRQAAGIRQNATPERARELIARLLRDQPDCDAVASIVAGAVGLTDEPASTQETFWAFRKLIEGLARERPLVLVFDDLHWAEPTFLDLVEQLGETACERPILIVCMARPDLLEQRAAWVGGHVSATSLPVEPLGRDEAGRLIDELAGPTLDDETRGTIVASAEGNPLFIEEMIAVVREQGAVSVTPTIQALLAARLDHLTRDERAAVEAAAVAGKSFSGRVVQALTGDELVEERLDSLVRKELIRQQLDSTPDDRWFRFRHILIRDAAYDALPKSRRSHLHERYADWLEGEMGERVREVEEILGYHLEQAHVLRVEVGLPVDERLAGRAGRLLVAAGGRAFAREDMSAARRLLERACSLLPAGDPARLEAERQLGGALWATGDYDRAEETLDTVVGAALATGDRRVEWSARLARAGFRQGPEEIESTAAEAVTVFEELGDELGLARAWRRRAFASFWAGRLRTAEEQAATALAHAKAAGDRQEEARDADILSMSLLVGPTHAAEAALRCEALLDESAGSILMEANVAGALAPLYAMCDRETDARRVAARARERGDELGNALARASLAQTVALTELLLGDAKAAELELEPTLALLRPSLQEFTLLLLGEALCAQGRRLDAAELIEAVEPTSASSRARLDALRSKLASEPALAVRLAESAVAAAGETEETNLLADAFVALAQARARSGSRSEAQLALGHALELFEAKGHERAARRVRALVSSAPAR